MRLPALFALAATLTGCVAAGPPAPRTLQAQQELDRYLGGRVAGREQSCLPRSSADNMIVIDDSTVLFRDGGRIWRTELRGGCPGLASRHYAMVTRQFGSGGLCSGEPFQLLDTSSQTFAGSCSFGEFIPFVRPR